MISRRTNKNIVRDHATGASLSDAVLNGVERELRHPVATLVAASDLLAEQLGPDHPGIGFAWLIRNESDRLHRTLRDMDLLALPLPFAARETDLRPALMEAAARTLEKADLRGIEVASRVPTEPLRALAHSEAVATAADRALSVAVECSPQGGSVTLDAERGPEGGAIVRICDSGPAVPAALVQELFAPYSNLPGRRPGLGLAVCKRIVEHLGGRAAAANRPEGGLVIELRFRPFTGRTESISRREGEQ
jgi:signal transduction histidine kinase